MGRYINRIPIQGADPNFVMAEISKYMTNEGFSVVNYKGQNVWKKGIGVATAPQYVAINFDPAAVTVEAFIRFALLPGVYIGEMGTKGFFGALPKAKLKERVATIENFLYSIFNAQVQNIQNQQAQQIAQMQAEQAALEQAEAQRAAAAFENAE